MVKRHLTITLYKELIALFCVASLAIAPGDTSIMKNPSNFNAAMHMKSTLWLYLREGINYLEASGREVPPHFMHSGRKAYGPLALTPIAIEDVKKHYSYLAGIQTEEVILNKRLYEIFAFFYARLLLKHYLGLNYSNMPKEEVFSILEKAWFLGPTSYLKGRGVMESREERASEYIRGICP